jgi:hypothetical protein
MYSRRTSSASPASGSKRSRAPDTLEEAWRLQCKQSAAGSRRAACRYRGSLYMPSSLREFAPGGLWYKADPPLKPMSGPVFNKWRADRERNRRSKAAWEASTSGGFAPPAGEEAEEAEEGEDPLFLKALAASLKDDADKKRAEEEDKAAAIAAVKEKEARDAEENATIIFLDD